MYVREVSDTVLTFGVSGKLIMNGLVMYDRETGSLWSQVIGQGVDGLHKGSELTIIPALQTTWQRWLSAHPETLVLDKRGRYLSDGYMSYYTDSSLGIFGQTERDGRLGPKEFVVGVTINGRFKAYPFSELDKTPVVNDVLDGVPLLVTFDRASDPGSAASPAGLTTPDPASATGVVFSPVVDGQRLTFREVPGSGAFSIEDLETRTVWDPFTGVGLQGPLAGTTLERLASHYEFWFAWKDYRPQTELYEAPGKSRDEDSLSAG